MSNDLQIHGMHSWLDIDGDDFAVKGFVGLLASSEEKHKTMFPGVDKDMTKLEEDQHLAAWYLKGRCSYAKDYSDIRINFTADYTISSFASVLALLHKYVRKGSQVEYKCMFAEDGRWYRKVFQLAEKHPWEAAHPEVYSEEARAAQTAQIEAWFPMPGNIKIIDMRGKKGGKRGRRG